VYAGEESVVRSVGAINKPYPKGEFEINAAEAALKNFGFAKALAYPFKFKTSLILGAIMFMLFTLGQSVAGFGISMYFAAIICFMLANTLVFGCLANTFENFSQGKTDKNFMPGFDEFSMWDDIIHPFFLSLAVYLISFGLSFVLIACAVSYASDSESKIEADKQKIISTIFPDAQNNSNSAKQTTDLQKLKENIKQTVQARVHLETEENIETEKKGIFQTAATVMRLSLVFSVPIFLAMLWGIFYFPVACAIAAYTRSFTAILNPSVGFDTIKRLGSDYVKVIVVFLILAVAALGLNAILQAALSSVNLPFLGNLPAKAVLSLFIFYCSIVFSITLSVTFLKASSRLNLNRG
jgi:hypothetical protein